MPDPAPKSNVGDSAQARNGADVSDRLIAARQAFVKFAAEIEQVLALLAQQADELRQQQAACAAMEAALAADRQQLEQIAAEVEQRQKEVTARSAELEQLESELRLRAEALADRERAVGQLQAAIAEISQVLAETDAELAADGLPAGAVAGPPLAVGAREGSPADGREACQEEQASALAAQDGATAGKESALEQQPDAGQLASQAELAAQPLADGTVDESSLDPQTRERLRVMRRLTGGRVPDIELLARIRGEQQVSAPSAGSEQRKPKRRWWGG